ncbi:hypothetical protein P154DRAFT_520441 [Amniculicola lignicola CBS 123094]|uniref:Uncharacterized protein n=1 Tax=Amniculicola lignicola CBS 123094 TaxID=1392246 RepID=A0A6A5WZY0_9PLEO|nr:hypothetical protein P154DRAFT_520441 [Amniculicola lignicola CBS 123094]
MTVDMKRKRGAVSYKEPSSEDFSDDSDEAGTSRKRRLAPQRRSARHRTPPQQQQQAAIAQAQPGPSRPSPQKAKGRDNVRLRRRQAVTYRESSSDDFGDESSANDAPSPASRTKARISKEPRPRKIKKSGRPTRKGFGAPLKPNNPAQATQSYPSPEIVSDGIIPPFSTLPYHVLLQIFVYASHPLRDENFVATSSIPWLVRVARMCSAFTKPALTALYRNPPIFATRQNRRDLVQRLVSHVEGTTQDYTVMVKRLELDGTKMSKLTDPTHSAADLIALVSSLRTLKQLEIFDPIDRPPYRERSKRIRRWHYPNELFQALRDTDIRLSSWRWNSTFSAPGLLWMKDIHAEKPFQNIRDLTLTKYHSDPPRKENEEAQVTAEEILASALAVLPKLHSLTFESCLVVNDRLLPLLPSSLVSLNFTNCRDLTADSLNSFLVSHGGHLEELVLHHNQSMDLSFLVDLKRSCPKLEVLSVDMHYYSSLVMSLDNEPLWDELLPEGEIPSWPSTLRIIDLEYLRKWSPTSAIAFFNSLIDSAEELPALRELTILATVDVGWRERAEFRKKWTARFQEVFASRWTPPSAHLASLRAFREWKSVQGASDDAEKNDSMLDVKPEEEASPAILQDEDVTDDSDEPLLAKRKQKQGESWGSKRLRTRAKPSSYNDSSDNDTGSGSEAGPETEEVKFVQGRCHVVTFNLDNFRPNEIIYNEADFLDAEISGDEDWNGNDAADDTIYAW